MRDYWLARIPQGMTLEDAFINQSKSFMELRRLVGCYRDALADYADMHPDSRDAIYDKHGIKAEE